MKKMFLCRFGSRISCFSAWKSLEKLVSWHRERVASMAGWQWVSPSYCASVPVGLASAWQTLTVKKAA